MNESQPGVNNNLDLKINSSIPVDRISRRLICFLFSAVLFSYPFSARSASTEEFDECDIESSIAFEDWRQWAKTTPEPYFSREHGSRWVTIYFDELAGTSDKSSSGQFAVCAKIIKVHYFSERSRTLRKLFLMAKMPAGFDPDHGDWWYGNYNATAGAAMIEQGVVEACIDCHQRASGLDYVFSKPMFANSTK